MQTLNGGKIATLIYINRRSSLLSFLVYCMSVKDRLNLMLYGELKNL